MRRRTGFWGSSDSTRVAASVARRLPASDTPTRRRRVEPEPDPLYGEEITVRR
ncbi:hypothetical protein NJ7G_3976 [Natrinema sp. J7-2]|nr:hypothetical protein NJ7G_3976 [Natrinema sp. J7-2]